MADNNSSQVGVGAAGKVYIAPSGTALPTDATTALADTFVNFGYISEDGITTSEDRSTDGINSWGGSQVRTISSSYTETVAFMPIEVNETVLKATYGDDNVEVTAGDDGSKSIVAKHSGVDLPEVVIVIDAVQSAKVKSRYVIPAAQLTERGDQALTGTDVAGRELTYTANPDGSGYTMYEYDYIAA